VSEEHAATMIARARIPDLTSASPLLAGSLIADLRGDAPRIFYPYRCNCKALHSPGFGCLRHARLPGGAWVLVGNVILSGTLGAFVLEDAEAVERTI
jgi:hypothetical protein